MPEIRGTVFATRPERAGSRWNVGQGALVANPEVISNRVKSPFAVPANR
jgi:hypothetical protein